MLPLPHIVPSRLPGFVNFAPAITVKQHLFLADFFHRARSVALMAVNRSMDTNTFHLFSNLPAELRVKIWELNLPGPRLVSLRYLSAATDPSNHLTRKVLRGCTSSAPIPTNLHVNREARANALQYYQLSFNLHHCPPKIWFDSHNDILHFPPKEGWLGSWNHFVNAISMITSVQLGKLSRLAVHESLFRGVRGATSSPNVQATCAREFWEYVSRKFRSIEEVAILVDENGAGTVRQDEVAAWIEVVLGCVSDQSEACVGSSEERLAEGLERGLRSVEEETEWKAPRWQLFTAPDWTQTGILGLPAERWNARPRKFGAQEKSDDGLESIVIPHPMGTVKKEKDFWMGGQLPHWYFKSEI